MNGSKTGVDEKSSSISDATRSAIHLSVHSRFLPHDLNDVNGILTCIRRSYPDFRIHDSRFFNHQRSLQIGSLDFVEFDYGIAFGPFLHGFDDRLLNSSAALETFRCFFLHLGVGTGIHPFALQEMFRHHCHTIIDDIPEESRAIYEESIQSVLNRMTVGDDNNFVDSHVLTACWPVEFDQVRVLIVNHHIDPPQCTLFDPSNDPSSQRSEVVLRLHGGHYTALHGFTIGEIQSRSSFVFQSVSSENFLHNHLRQQGQRRCSVQDIHF